MKKNGFGINEVLFIILVIVIMLIIFLPKAVDVLDLSPDKSFKILASNDNQVYDTELMKFAKENDIELIVVYKDDLEAIPDIEENSTYYDALWLSNSTWIYMLNNVKTLNSKSTNINPVVFGVKKSKAKELDFIDKDIYNKDIVDAIKNKKLKYVMSSVIKTNNGLVAYLGFLNALAGSPEILTSTMIEDKKLQDKVISFFSGVERVSGSQDFLSEMFLNSDDYEAVIASESELININKKLVNSGKEPLYLLYPVDGVAINDSPFAYVDYGQNKLETFNKIQSFILSNDSQKKLEALGKRTWYGGIKESADTSSFKKEWGIDTTKYLNALKYPSKTVIEEAINLYIELFRKESATVFCLDYSGSMYSNGDNELKEAMRYILDSEEAKKERLQFSSKDIVMVIPFSTEVHETLKTTDGKKTKKIIESVNERKPSGGTNLYGCATKAMEELENIPSNYNKMIILMTDGEANIGTYYGFKYSYNKITEKINTKIPIYGILFGSAKREELNEIANLTNARVFDGRYNLKEAFKEVRSYN